MYIEPDPARGVYANRTLNLRSVEAIGYDMDYTLIHYRTAEWEGVAFQHACRVLESRGFPVKDFEFNHAHYLQGLVIDLELGNLVKASRFGYVIQAQHGTATLSFDEVRTAYAGVVVDLAEPRFRFLNTLFSISEAALYAQMVDRLDSGALDGPYGYADLYRLCSSALDESHTTGAVKAEIVNDPDRFCELDPETAQTLIDQRMAGKRLLLITNSEWSYAQAMMSYAFDRFTPSGNWRELFDMVIVAAAKPRFFIENPPSFRLVDAERGLLEPHVGLLKDGEVYHGASADMVERSLELTGDQILYIGDHLFGDMHVTKSEVRWRTAFIIRELEAEIAAAAAFTADEAKLRQLMAEKADLEHKFSLNRMARATEQAEGLPPVDAADLPAGEPNDRLRAQLRELDDRISPLARAATNLGNPHWGPLMRAGNDKSLFARQVEKYADVYTSRVSNFRRRTPYAFLRAARTSLPHEL